MFILSEFIGGRIILKLFTIYYSVWNQEVQNSSFSSTKNFSEKQKKEKKPDKNYKAFILWFSNQIKKLLFLFKISLNLFNWKFNCRIKWENYAIRATFARSFCVGLDPRIWKQKILKDNVSKTKACRFQLDLDRS